MENTMTTTDRNPLDLLTAGENETILAKLDSLPRQEREELAASGMVTAWMVDLAKHLISWRGRE